MQIKNYNQQLKEEYRTVLVALISTLEKSECEREQITQVFNKKAKQLQTSDKTVTTDWLRARAYRADLYALVSEWVAKTAYACLLDIDTGQPQKDEEWFAMVGLFVRQKGGQAPIYDELVKQLPIQLDNENGRQWLKICINAINTIQDRYRAAQTALNELSSCPRQSLCMQFIFTMNLCDHNIDNGQAERMEWEGNTYYEYHSLRALLDPLPVESNGAKALVAMQECQLVERLRLTPDNTVISEGESRFQRKSVRVFWRLTDKTRLLLNPKQLRDAKEWITQGGETFKTLHELSALLRQSLCLQFLLLLNMCRYDLDKGIVQRKAWENKTYYAFHSLREQLTSPPLPSNADKALVDMQALGLVERLKVHDDGTRILEHDNNYQRRAVTIFWALTHKGEQLLQLSE
ncbi:hypothetical protein [Vibrio anguillarum]|uniref:hypothetical protein n=1 Tax=Vibrio anguillarum TaxID=55601 RepID=UPI00188AA742|nr:hypothetical protein [Vibrio anguillarum]MBF4390041.1 hypothetical protein [Vibrio anguillarum]